MNKYLFIIFLPFFFVNTSSAQIAIAVAKEENYPFSQIEYRVEWGYGNRWDAEMHSMKYLKDKGYKNIILPLLYKERSKLTNGFWVVIKTERIQDGKQKVGFSLGASADSQSDAEKNAVENLANNDGNWRSSQGYSIDKKGLFDEAPQKQLMYIIRSRQSACGDNAFDISYMLGTYDNAIYQRIYSGFVKRNKDENTTINVVHHIIRDDGIVGILKCNQRCSDGTIRSIYRVVDCNTEAELRQLAPYDKNTIADAGETKYFIYDTFGFTLPENRSILRETLEILRNMLIDPKQKELLIKWSGTGVRG